MKETTRCCRPLTVAAYTGALNTPSARMRVRQHIQPLTDLGIVVHDYPLSAGWAVPQGLPARASWALSVFTQRSLTLARSYTADVTLVQKHLMPGMLPLERLLHRPLLVDFDDALWLRRRTLSFDRLLTMCDAVICGNSYLADHASHFARSVHIVPTAVDTDRFTPLRSPPSDHIVIGWSGSKENLSYLYNIEPALRLVLSNYPSARLRVVCDEAPRFATLPTERIEYVQWSTDTEVTALRTMSIGLMPLDDTSWCRGKCSFKMLSYMAAALPVVVSPVGMNRELLNAAHIGFGPNSPSEWADALMTLVGDRRLATSLGRAGRALAVEQFSIPVIARKLATLLAHESSAVPQ
jgi:Glycosyl transferases group 1